MLIYDFREASVLQIPVLLPGTIDKIPHEGLCRYRAMVRLSREENLQKLYSRSLGFTKFAAGIESISTFTAAPRIALPSFIAVLLGI